MNRLINYSLVLFSTLLLSWIIPSAYQFVTQESETPQFVIYSSVNEDFLSQQIIKEDSFVYKDRKGNVFNQYQMDSLVPSLGYRMLMLQGRLPDSIMGRKISADEFQLHNFFFSHSPEDINKKTPKLYSLMESEPKRIELSLPNDVFRLTDYGIEFIDLRSNKVVKQKSELYTKEMKKVGMQFPIQVIGGNPTPLKKYDNGYVLADCNNRLFQLKMAKGNPVIEKISDTVRGKVKNIFVTEYPDKRFIAFVVDSNNKLYAIDTGQKKLHLIGVPSFDPEKENLIILGNVFDWNIEVNRNGDRRIYAVKNEDLSLLDSIKIDTKTTIWQDVEKYIFPIKIAFTDKDDQYFFPRLDISNMKYSLLVNIILLIIFIFYQRKNKRPCFSYFYSALIIIFGIFGVIACLSFSNYRCPIKKQE